MPFMYNGIEDREKNVVIPRYAVWRNAAMNEETT